MPQDHVGVEIGYHSQLLYNVVSYNLYERLEFDTPAWPTLIARFGPPGY